ncbi:thermonuclease family protein [Dechloromonas sp. H13]|uniref:thermonuclease family protein n=1 Tax=Dechloromonas sp. H13 TaxID=2570193 RepID=UPI001D188899|nr:thermonuclease family protein [Dechloromonas sp. H13]
MKKPIAILFLALSFGAHADTLLGRVVGVADGDTVTVLDAGRQQHKIRLQGIDAPEKKQPFGERSKQNLARMVFGKDVRVEWEKRDKYKRIVGKVWVQPASCPTCPMTLDAGHAQITVGLAWWYRKYAGEQSPQDRGAYEHSEQEARARRAGLWSDPDPVPPWEWRRR